MKPLALTLFVSLLVVHAFAQNKTLGVGTTTLNPNAALQVDAPNGNQGVLLPRLTTAQRTAMTLTAADKGLVVYDTDLNLTHTWNGTLWMNGLISSAAQKLVLPYQDSIASATGTNNLFTLKYNNAETKRLLRLENLNPNNPASTASVLQNGTGIAGYFQVNNATNGGTAVYATTNSNLGGALAPVGVYGESTGTGSVGGAFWNTNATNTWPALYAKTLGTSSSFRAETSTGFASIFALQSSTSPNKNAIQGVHDGTGNGLAGLFQNTNAANQYPAIQAETAGVGHGVKVLQNATSLGGGLGVFIQNTASTALGVTVDQQGLGTAGQFVINNAASASPGLLASTNGTDVAIRGEATGSGSAGNFRVLNPASTNTALYAEQQGTGPAIVGAKWLTANGHSGWFINNNNGNTESTLRAESTSNSANAFESLMFGASSAGYFEVNNAGSVGAGLYSTTNGTGAAIQGQTDTGFAAIYGRRQGASNGNAGKFEITDAANTYPALDAVTSGSGPALAARITNATSGAAAFNSNTNGTGAAGSFITSGTGSAGYFQVGLTSNTTPALYVENYGSGTSAYLSLNNPSSGATSFFTSTNGTGNAANFQINNSSSPSVSLSATTNGLGNVLNLDHTGASGDIALFRSSGTAQARIDKTGKGFFNGGTQTGGADLAELFDVEGNKTEYEPGDVLVISESTDRTVEKSSSPNSTKVAGVYATKPGVTLTEKDINQSIDELVPMGVIGVIPTKVCHENGVIMRGDLLVTSSRPGHAMKAVSLKGDGVFPSGVIIGKALENFDGESGTIKVLVNVK